MELGERSDIEDILSQKQNVREEVFTHENKKSTEHQDLFG